MAWLWAGKLLGAWTVCVPIICVYGFTVYAIGLTQPLLIGVLVNVGLLRVIIALAQGCG